ncbi:hypothetical protein [Yersinia intermedia]|uniref:hypothetical protein n=1 Tax=Yersinia intermedia TaxID=631 RepID=UPI0009BC0081|nr:hypothetical protein [Yersinia intermedia]AVL37461.1 hypothetical protein CEQ36_19015 [Yersinia intermedia]MDN0117222.1 hypothetical protein [Yersinia intermedia]
MAEVIHNMTTEANLMAHAVLGAVVAQVNGNSALPGRRLGRMLWRIITLLSCVPVQPFVAKRS